MSARKQEIRPLSKEGRHSPPVCRNGLADWLTYLFFGRRRISKRYNMPRQQNSQRHINLSAL